MGRTRARPAGLATAGLVAATVLLAACASRAGSEPPVSPKPSVSPATSSPLAAANRSAAQSEADRLLSAVALPAGSVRTAREPATLSGLAMGTPVVSQLIDSVAYYRVALPLGQAHLWFQDHPQPESRLAGSSMTGKLAHASTYGFEYDPAAKSRWTWGSANLQVGMASAGPTSTDIRVDGVAEWIDPTPVRVSYGGPTIRLAAADQCPVTDKGPRDVANPGDADLDDHLLPTGAPDAALECNYDGTNGLRGSEHLTAEQAGAEAKRIQALPLGSRGAGPINCPADFGNVTILAFSYPGRADVDIWELTSGCTSTDNGHIVANQF